MKFFHSKRRVAAAAALLLLVLFLLRPGASRIKWRIVSSISSGVGRPVAIGSVHLRLLPRPGFDLQNLVIAEDPAFGAEPMLRASEVTADLRLTSLLRGRIEIARLDLTEPSLNLVRGDDGRWNLEALLERTAHTPLAPTAKVKTERRTGFPYIEATSARINFKKGPEKKAYALTNADFSLWQDSDNAWGVRLKAQPFRTDMNLNDTGMLQLNGTWQRSDALRDTPLQFSVEWSRAQLGQITKFVSGSDQGWRGTVLLDVTLAGTPAKLQVTSDLSIQDFRRFDILSGDALRAAAHCTGQYSSLDYAVHEVDCSAPAGGGLITLQGDMGPLGSHNLGLKLSVSNVPASAAVALVQRAKRNLPEDLSAGGMINGNLLIQEGAATASKLQFEGRGKISDFQLASATSKAEIGPETIPFSFSADTPRGLVTKDARRTGVQGPAGPHVEVGPFPVAIGRGTAPVVRGWIDRTGYNVSVAGDADVGKALRAARMIGVPALQAAVVGAAQMDLQLGGSWAGWSYGASQGFPGPQTRGWAKLRGVRIEMRGAGGPVEISSAEIQLLPDEVRVAKLNAKAADIVWTGSIEMPRGCGTPAACVERFNLNAGEVSWHALSEWVRPAAKKRPWYRLLESDGQGAPSFLASVRASGRVSAEHVLAQNLTADRVSANVNLDAGKLQISDLSAEVLGGKHVGEWRADYSTKPGTCSGNGALTGISLARFGDEIVSGAANDQWIGGTANATYQVKGECPGDFWSSAEGMLKFDVKDSILSKISLDEDSKALKVARFDGQATLRAGRFEIEDARLDSASGAFLVSGTASFQRELELKLARPAHTAGAGYKITGTLGEPRVVPVALTEQARLKP